MHIASGEWPIPLGIKRARLRANIATNRLLMASMWLRLLTEKANFDPDQPRAPAGDPAGGQWVDTGASGSSRLRRIAGADEEETKPNRSVVDETLDPTGELRTEAYNNALQGIRQLEPNNRQLESATTLDYVPTWQTVNETAAELEAARSRVAYQIAQGHAFDEHADEFGTDTSAELSSIIRSVISDPSAQVGNLPSGQTLFYDQAANILVVVDPDSEDYGSIYKPSDGQAYVNRLLKRR